MCVCVCAVANWRLGVAVGVACCSSSQLFAFDAASQFHLAAAAELLLLKDGSTKIV